MVREKGNTASRILWKKITVGTPINVSFDTMEICIVHFKHCIVFYMENLYLENNFGGILSRYTL